MSDDALLVRKFITAIHAISDADWEAFTMHWQPFTAKRKQY
jgi:hypothetical protein